MFKALFIIAAASAAHADINVTGVKLTASNDLTIEATASGRALSLTSANFRDADPAVTLTDQAVTLTAQRVGDQIAVVAVEDGTDLGQVDLFSPSNGNYKLATPKPIVGRSAGLAADFQSVMLQPTGADGTWNAAKTLAAMQTYFTANPTKQFSVFRRQLSLGQVTAPAAPPAPAAPAVPVAITAPPSAHAPVTVRPATPRADPAPVAAAPSQRPMPSMPAMPPMPRGWDDDEDADPFFRPMPAPRPAPRHYAREPRGEDVAPPAPMQWPNY